MATRVLALRGVLAAALRGGGGLPSVGRATARAYASPRQHVTSATSAISATTDGDDNGVQLSKSYLVVGRGAGAATTVHARHHTVAMDVPKPMGGKDAAPQPVELLLSALMVWGH